MTLQGEKRTLVLGLRFDVIIRLREEAEVYACRRPRRLATGPPDLGFKADIADDYPKALDAELLGIAAGS